MGRAISPCVGPPATGTVSACILMPRSMRLDIARSPNFMMKTAIAAFPGLLQSHAHPSRGSRTMTGVSVDRRPARPDVHPIPWRGVSEWTSSSGLALVRDCVVGNSALEQNDGVYKAPLTNTPR